MVIVTNIRIEAVFGCTPADAVDNESFLSPLFGDDKASSIVKSTGFTVRRAARPGVTVTDLALPAARAALADTRDVGGIVFTSFSSPERYPSRAQLLQTALGLPCDIAAFDVQLACSGYPYGLYLAARLAADTGKRVLLVDGDVQTAFLSPADAATNAVMHDGASATLVAPGGDGEWKFDFFTDGALAPSLRCPGDGPVQMRGFEVFRFVMGDVAAFLRRFLAETGRAGAAPMFVPHQANLYMLRRLADDVGVPQARLLISGDRFGNPGSASIAVTLAAEKEPAGGEYLLAGFGAGLSAAAALITIDGSCRRGIVEF